MKRFVPLASMLALLPAIVLPAAAQATTSQATTSQADTALLRLGPPGSIAAPPPGFCLLQSAALTPAAPLRAVPTAKAPVCDTAKAVLDKRPDDPGQPHVLQPITRPAPAVPTGL